MTNHNDTASQEGMLGAALAAAHFGLFVFPVHTVRDGRCSCGKPRCKHPGKHPLASLAPKGHLDATRDEARIRQWWNQSPDANIGVALVRSGLLVIGPDSPEWAEAFHQRGLPPTMHVKSGGGAGHEHYWYRRPDGCPMHRLCKSDEYDIIADGYGLLPPSMHESGRPCSRASCM